jgi:hypothetical protein
MDILCTSCVGVDEKETAQPVSVFPNPASSNVNVSVNTGTSDILTLKLMNSLGTVVYNQTISTSGKLNHSINVGKFAEGMYFLVLEGKNLNYTQKVTIQR